MNPFLCFTAFLGNSNAIEVHLSGRVLLICNKDVAVRLLPIIIWSAPNYGLLLHYHVPHVFLGGPISLSLFPATLSVFLHLSFHSAVPHLAFSPFPLLLFAPIAFLFSFTLQNMIAIIYNSTLLIYIIYVGTAVIWISQLEFFLGGDIV